MPVSSSILWKPLRDPHYVVASLQPGGGGRRQLSIKQTTLSQVQAQARGAFGQIAVGLLLGNRYECPATGMAYVLIESSVDGAPVPDEHWLGPAVSGLLDRLKTRDSLECVGWYCSTPVVGGRLGAVHAAIHTALFRQPWQTTLIVTDSGDSGGLFLNDPLATRWFLSPFFEEIEPTRNRQAAKPTCIVWPTYLTTDVIVAPTSPEPAPPEPRLAAPAPRYQPTPRPEIRAEPRPEMRTEPRPVLRPEPRPVSRPEVRREPRPLFRPEPRPEVRAEPQPEVRAKPQPEVHTEPQPEIRVEPRPEVRVEPRPEVRVEPRPEVRAEPRPEVRAEPAPERRPQPWAVPRPQPHLEPRVEFAAEPRAEPPAEARTELRSEPEPQAAPERPARPILAPAALATRQATAAIARASATSLKRATDAGATSLKRAADAGVSASRSGLGHLRDASAAVTNGIVRRAPDVRAAVASLGTSAVKGVSSVAQASVAFVTRAREAAARRREQAVAQREAAAQARREREAAQRAERAAAEQARHEREAAKRAERAAAEQARREAAERAQREAAERAQREAAERAQREAAERAKREAILRARAAPRTGPLVRTPASNLPVTNEPQARPRTQPAPLQQLGGQWADKQPPLQQPVIATQLADLEDTASSDPPFRYLALAARESFVVISNSEASRADHLEHWVLEEPEAGVLLTVITSDSAVREATLHYNLRTDDDALFERTPPEHRDLESRTIYVREPAIEGLRARCRRLRMGGALVREWKVSPPIDLPHPSRIHAGTNGESETRSATETSEPDALRMPPQ